ncbi:hypothetical protein GUJ93_ZPchr0010g10925 [Zizania palustris]|uniref:Uncharacterized protein n=1 Tax=Zizania palustris TaxID=103762 RepID=A0A8J5W8C6_ZIZPA|nr:hypothetical protein GUJ93_ZPchr0149g29158 [Zizania palustris]KAG8084789.1 hypothetical protein GUJ93_ZPchr0010g10925 [Zizania palustris]
MTRGSSQGSTLLSSPSLAYCGVWSCGSREMLRRSGNRGRGQSEVENERSTSDQPTMTRSLCAHTAMAQEGGSAREGGGGTREVGDERKGGGGQGRDDLS